MSNNGYNKQSLQLFRSFLTNISPDDIIITKSFKTTVGRQWKTRPAVYTQYHVVYIRSGSADYFIDNKKYTISKGSIVFLSPGIRHKTHIESNTNPSIISFFFTISKKINITKFHLVMQVIEKEKFETLFLLAQNYFSNLDKTLVSKTSTLYITFIEMLHYQEKQLLPDKPYIRFADLISRMEKKPGKSIPVWRLAEIAGLSEDYFCRTFKKETGYSVHAMQIKIKIDRACILLDTTTMQIKEIADELGYPDQYTFSKQFKKLTGKSPLVYRKRG
jgi:AraC-like DNA-binding protein